MQQSQPPSAGEALERLVARLQSGKGVESDVAALEAVCWNWMLFGGAEGKGKDPKDVYAKLQSKFKKAWPSGTSSRPKPGDPEEHARLQEAALVLMLQEAGLSISEGSDLKAVLYYEEDAEPMYLHLEFDYKDEIVITKGNGAKLFAGKTQSEVNGRTVRQISLGVAINSLSPDHVRALVDLASKV